VVTFSSVVRSASTRFNVRDGHLAAFILLAVAVAFWVALPYVDIQGNHPVSDGAIYGAMAEHPASRISVLFGSTLLRDALPPPFIFRLLTPWTVWALPFGTHTGFKLVNVAGVAGGASMLYLYARTFFDRAAALRAVAYFVLAGNVLALLMDPWLVDGPTYFISILSFYLVRRDRIGWATVALCVGAAAHESSLLVLATLLFAHLVTTSWRFDLRLVPFVCLPVLVYVFVHNTSLAYGTTVTYEFWSSANRDAVLDTRRHLDGDLLKSVFLALATSFGAVWILAVIGFRRAPRFARASAIMLPLLTLNFLTASDWDRVLALAFPIVIVFACRVQLRWPFLLLFLVVQALISGLAIDRLTGYYHDELGHQHTTLTLALLAVALVVVLGAVATYGRAAKRAGASVSASSS
jgi:hypothetical protein